MPDRHGDPLRGVVDAFLAVVSGLDLQKTLHRIVRAAADLVDAEYGALGVLDGHGGLAEFVYVGIDEKTRAAIGPLPRGHGLVGLLIEHPQVMRLADLTTHPASVGFPPGHPEMHTLIGAPIRVRDSVFGNLYLTEKRGGGQFTDQDEAVLVALASAAGSAVENSRLYEEVRRRERWLMATSEIRAELLSGGTVSDALTLIARRAVDLAHADTALVLVADAATGLQVRAAAGSVDPAIAGTRIDEAGAWARVALRAAGPVRAANLPAPEEPALAAALPSSAHLLLAPLPAGASDGGVLICMRAKGSDDFDDDQVPLLAGLAEQASLALEVSDRTEQRRSMLLMTERERIARDLHDHVIQRLFAVGLSLQSQGAGVSDPRLRQRLDQAVEQVDEAIRDLRSSIFDLRSPQVGRPAGLRRRLMDIASSMDGGAMAVTIRIDGALDTLVTADLAEEVEAVVREGVSNAVRHSGGTTCAVAVHVGERLEIEITDDGRGIAPGASRSGLANLADRAAHCGGTLTVGASPSGGARLVWTAALPAD